MLALGKYLWSDYYWYYQLDSSTAWIFPTILAIVPHLGHCLPHRQAHKFLLPCNCLWWVGIFYAPTYGAAITYKMNSFICFKLLKLPVLALSPALFIPSSGGRQKYDEVISITCYCAGLITMYFKLVMYEDSLILKYEPSCF